MKGEREPGNPHNPVAVRIRAPPVEDVDPPTRALETRAPSRGRPRQTVQDVCSKVVGRVPRVICKYISQGPYPDNSP